MPDAHMNFSISTVATAPAPAASGTSLVVAAGDGAKFPTPPFNAVVCPSGSLPLSSNSEIVRVTAIASDTFTITRTQEGTSARTIGVGDQIFAAVTAKTLTDIETSVTTFAPGSAVTSLPGSPTDGQEIYYLADATNGVVWHLKYRAGSGSAYKWEFVGGGDLSSEVDAGESRTNNAYGDLTTVGPSVTLPGLAGDHVLDYGAGLNTNVAAQNAFCAPNVAGAVTDADSMSQNGSTTDVNSVGRSRLKTAVAASSVIKLQYRGNGGSTVYAEKRWLKVRPRRVG